MNEQRPVPSADPGTALLQTLYGQYPIIAFGNAVLSAANIYAYQHRLDDAALILFGGLVYALIALRLYGYFYFNRHGFERLSVPQHYRIVYVGALISGCIWGSWGWHVVNSVPQHEIMTMLIIQTGICAGTVSTSSASRLALSLFVIPVLMPLVWYEAKLGTRDSYTLATVILLYLIVILGSAKRTYSTIYNSVILAQKNQQLADRLYIYSNTDGLTNIANRRAFDNSLDTLHALSQRHKIPYSLLLIDVDFFKAYNDSLGHQAGDECLKVIAHSADRFFSRKGDIVARYGGEEFVIVLPGADGQSAFGLAQAFCQSIHDQNLPHHASEPFKRVTISVGVAEWNPARPRTQQQLLESADRALYQAKRGGRNQVRLAVEEPERKSA